MATNKAAITEGSGLNVATNTFTEDGVTKHVQRVVNNNSAGAEVGVAANPLAVTEGDDTSLGQALVTTNATAGVWVELMAASTTRQGAAVQSKSAVGSLFIVAATTTPAAGTAAGEIEIPPAPAYFKFDYVPKKRYFVRGAAASMTCSLVTW